jgi:hypothetical protein
MAYWLGPGGVIYSFSSGGVEPVYVSAPIDPFEFVPCSVSVEEYDKEFINSLGVQWP